MTPREALGFSIVLFALAVVFVLTLPVLAIVIAGVNLFALVAYTKLSKGVMGLGNAVVGYLTGSAFLFGAAAVGSVTVLVLFALAALSTVAREIMKDVEDMEGDREEGLSTPPIMIGSRESLILAAVVLALGARQSGAVRSRDVRTRLSGSHDSV